MNVSGVLLCIKEGLQFLQGLVLNLADALARETELLPHGLQRPGPPVPQAWKEFVHYEYEQNRQGEWISGYPDRDNHLIDATRYALERVSGKYRSQA